MASLAFSRFRPVHLGIAHGGFACNVTVNHPAVASSVFEGRISLVLDSEKDPVVRHGLHAHCHIGRDLTPVLCFQSSLEPSLMDWTSGRFDKVKAGLHKVLQDLCHVLKYRGIVQERDSGFVVLAHCGFFLRGEKGFGGRERFRGVFMDTILKKKSFFY